eukprot:6346193-Alexandrium_andersonii.AAC.1
MSASLVGSEMCIRDRGARAHRWPTCRCAHACLCADASRGHGHAHPSNHISQHKAGRAGQA